MIQRDYLFPILIAALIFFGALGFLFWYGGAVKKSLEPVRQPEPKQGSNQELKPEDSGAGDLNESVSPGPEIRVLPEGEPAAESSVRYRNGVFEPREILLKDQGAGCIVAVYNDDKEEILLRLSPHGESGDPGFSYDPIPGGSMLRLDPRYSGFSEVRFHNHYRFGSEFTVKFMESCAQ